MGVGGSGLGEWTLREAMVGTLMSSLEKSLGVEGLEGFSLGELWGMWDGERKHHLFRRACSLMTVHS